MELSQGDYYCNFGRKEFCLMTGLKFGAYNPKDFENAPTPPSSNRDGISLQKVFDEIMEMKKIIEPCQQFHAWVQRVKDLESILKQNTKAPTKTYYKADVDDQIDTEVRGEEAFDVRKDSGFRFDASQDAGSFDFEHAGWLNFAQTPSEQLRVFSSLATREDIVRLYIVFLCFLACIIFIYVNLVTFNIFIHPLYMSIMRHPPLCVTRICHHPCNILFFKMFHPLLICRLR